MNVDKLLIPGLILCETHFAYRKEKGVVAEAVAQVAEEGFFGGIAIAEVDNGEDRKRIRKTVESHGIALTQWTSMVLGDENLDLCSTDSHLRTRSVARITERISQAAECGVSNIGILCGPDPGEDRRAAATEALYESLNRLCEVVATYPGMRLLIEPQDRDIHKKGLIGPTAEAVAIVERLQESFPVPGLCLDTGHAVLLGEAPEQSLECLGSCVLEIHFSNPVLDHAHPAFGDTHGPPGPPGVSDVEDFARVLTRGVETGILARRRPIVSVEIRTAPGADPWETVERSKTALRRTLDLTRGKLSESG